MHSLFLFLVVRWQVRLYWIALPLLSAKTHDIWYLTCRTVTIMDLLFHAVPLCDVFFSATAEAQGEALCIFLQPTTGPIMKIALESTLGMGSPFICQGRHAAKLTRTPRPRNSKKTIHIDKLKSPARKRTLYSMISDAT